MKQIIAGSVVIGASVIFASLVYSGNVTFKDEHVIQLDGGAVKLGDVREEHKVVSVKLQFDDKSMDNELLTMANMDEYKDALKKKLQLAADAINVGVKDDEKKATPESISLKVPAKLEVTTAVHYTSQYQPSFTLTLGSETVPLASGDNLYNAVTKVTDDYIKSQKEVINQSLYITNKEN
ncbi:hypothetical protein [Mangrovibacter yixingensis]|uniref:hypothetical protein n=1 Tax=Mangrovibacter yixingensis TaxID=1529639 RepID=UPI001CFBBE15|nr:hypothetical protein [Mangrovibacter yixingensis]